MMIATSRTAQSEAAGRMGPLELRAYKLEWTASSRFRRQIATVAPAHNGVLLAFGRIADAKSSVARGFEALRKAWEQDDYDPGEQDEPVVVRRAGGSRARPVSAAAVVARLLFARLFDQRPDLLRGFGRSSPPVIIDVHDAAMLELVATIWQDTLLSPSTRVMHLDERHGARENYDVVLLKAVEAPKGKQVADLEREVLWALQLALPVIAMSPSAETHLPQSLLKAAPVRIRFPSIDPVTIARAIRIITGKPCRELMDDTAAARISPADMMIAIRFDRTPEECMVQLRRLAAERIQRKSARYIQLHEIHGMSEAVDWARASIKDLEAWRRGEIPWSAVSHSICLEGPPGTGKTMFAASFAAAADVEMIGCSLAAWQGSDDGHLGHLLRAMRKDFEKARANAPCVLFIDEIDSFPDRSKVRHAHADYVTQVVNAFIAELDGVGSREGLLFCAASNDLSRCDPAILRSGRFNKVVRIGLPDAGELKRMFRVRLRGELATACLDDICLLGLGSTGADVERIVADARRLARHQGRPIEIDDLRKALTGADDRDHAEVERTAVHEGGHILADVLLFGDEQNLHATITASGERGGATIRTKSPPFAGTHEDYARRLQVLLAGRIAEEITLGAYTHSSGGGRGSDLDQATRLAAAMVASLGLAGPYPLLYLGPREDVEKLLSYSEMRRAAHEELTVASDACRILLLQHRRALDEIAATLLENGSVTGAKVAGIVAGTSIGSLQP